jgi:RNA polymerase sigma-70 factor, ECF subfamily
MQPAERPVRALEEDRSSDAEIVERIRSGNRSQFALLVKRHNQRLYRIARSIVRDDEEAEDIVQQAHVTAFRMLDQFRGEASYATWLTRITVNEALGRLRKSKRHGLVPLEQSGEEGTAVTTPEDDTYRRELARLLEREIDDLPDALRVVFVMRDVEELDTAETASTLGISEEAVRVRLHRARHALQSSLAHVLTAAPDAFHFAGDRCARITRAVLAELDLE